jgi:hypothetical protein
MIAMATVTPQEKLSPEQQTLQYAPQKQQKYDRHAAKEILRHY